MRGFSEEQVKNWSGAYVGRHQHFSFGDG